MLRSLARTRGLAVVTAATIALGVGTLTTALGIADAALWRAPPFPAARDLVLLVNTRRSATEPLHPERWSYPRIQRLRQRIQAVPRIANFTSIAASLTGTELTEPLQGEVVSPEYFAILRAVPAVGRVFAEGEDDRAGDKPVAVLSDRLWRRRFGGDTGIVGRTIEINRSILTILGVMPPRFRGVSDAAEFWVPTTMAPILSYDEYLTTNQNFINLIARLPDRGTLTGLRAELAVLGPAIAREVPADDDDIPSVVGATAITLGEARIASEQRRSVRLLLAAVAVLHLLACANAANLLLGRAVTLRREAAVRAALGSNPLALFGGYLRQNAALVSVGALGGLILAWAAGGAVVPLNTWGTRNFYGSIATFSDPSFGWRSLIGWFAVSLATVALVAWAPAIATVRGDLPRDLREGTGGGSSGLSLKRPSARAVVVAIEAALAILLLTVGGLMIESFARMRRAPLGVEPDRVLTFTLNPQGAATPAAAALFIDRVLAAIGTVPDVVSSSVDGGAPLAGSASTTLRIVGVADPGPGQAPSVLRHYVGPDHFSTLGVPLIRGRTFTDRDRADQPPVAVISESAARRFWPGLDPIGHRVWFGGSAFTRPDSSAEIVGIVGDVQYRPLDREPNRASFYTPYRQFTYGWRTYFVRTAGAPAAAVSGVREAIHQVDPNVPMNEVRPLGALIGASWARNRFDAYFFGGFAMVALVLAATGIYAVVGYAVQQRDKEIAIRLAVGASPAAVFRLVVQEGMAFPALGLLAGAAGAVAVARVLRSAVYGVSPNDPRILVAATLVLLAVALLACAVPALRATRVSPHEALRAD